jgi:hypothetical protein
VDKVAAPRWRVCGAVLLASPGLASALMLEPELWLADPGQPARRPAFADTPTSTAPTAWDGPAPRRLKLDPEPGPVPPSPLTRDSVGAEPARRFESLHLEGRHAEAASVALDLLALPDFRPSDDLRLHMARSLSWTGHEPEARAQYEALADGPSRGAALLALANSWRWGGRPDLSLPLYRSVPSRSEWAGDARDGLELAGRELNRRTTFQVNLAADNQDMRILARSINHRWRDSTLRHAFEFEIDTRQQRATPAEPDFLQSDLTLRYEGVALPFDPRLWVTLQNKPFAAAYGGLKIKLIEPATQLTLARLSWGNEAFSAKAMQAGLSAGQIGLETRLAGSPGVLDLKANFYAISDRNHVLNGQARYTPAWRPLGPSIRPYVAIDTHDVKFNTPDYWAPDEGSGTLGLGAAGDWGNKDLMLYASGQFGRRLYGDAGHSWSLGGGLQHWFAPEVALSFNLWTLSSRRDAARYRAYSGALRLDVYW